MELRFIGEHGSMGLQHGALYEVEIRSCDHYILVEWYDRKIGRVRTCPYGSVKAFAANWC